MTPLASLGFSGGPSGSGVVATGGAVATYANGKYKSHFFNTNGTFTVTSNPNLERFSIVIVGGGGSGGNGGYVANYYRFSGAGGASGSFNINEHFLVSGTSVSVVVGGSTGSSSITYDGSTITAAGGPSGNSNYPNNNLPVFPTVGVAQSGAESLNPYTNQTINNITGALSGAGYTHQALFAAGIFSGFGGVGAKGWDAFYNSPGVNNSGNGGAGGQSTGASGFNASGYGCGGGGGAAPPSNGQSTSGGAGSGGGVWILYRA
jgi:hypothetical protein